MSAVRKVLRAFADVLGTVRSPLFVYALSVAVAGVCVGWFFYLLTEALL